MNTKIQDVIKDLSSAFKYKVQSELANMATLSLDDNVPRIMLAIDPEESYIIISFSTVTLPIEVAKVITLLKSKGYDYEINRDFYLSKETKEVYFGMEAHTHYIADITQKIINEQRKKEIFDDNCLLDDQVFVTTRKIYAAGPEDLKKKPNKKYKNLIGTKD